MLFERCKILLGTINEALIKYLVRFSDNTTENMKYVSPQILVFKFGLREELNAEYCGQCVCTLSSSTHEPLGICADYFLFTSSPGKPKGRGCGSGIEGEVPSHHMPKHWAAPLPKSR